MTFPFYKLQLAGNGFILCDFLHFSEDEKDKPEFRRADWKATARKICSRRFGVGASGCIFLGRDNSIQIYNSEGLLTDEADDALLCAARYAFDSGRTDGKKILFHLPHAPEKKLKVDILGANEFRISCGAPFSLLKENVITPGSTEINEIIENEGIDGSYAAVHLREDVLVSWPHKRGAFSFQDFADLTHKAFPKKKVIPVVANQPFPGECQGRAASRHPYSAHRYAPEPQDTNPWLCSGSPATEDFRIPCSNRIRILPAGWLFSGTTMKTRKTKFTL